MFKKGPDIDKKKLLGKALDVKKDSLSRLKHFRTLIEHHDLNEVISLFKTHFSFIYHTFIDTFSTFDCNSKQRRDDLECILFMLDRILIYNPELIRKRWQFYSITFVMQKLLHRNNTWELRQNGVKLFILWYQILSDETNPELQTMFASLVPNVVPPSSLPINQQQPHQQHIGSTSPTMSIESMTSGYPIQHSANSQQQHSAINNPSTQLNNTTFNNNNNNNNYNNNSNDNTMNVPQLPIKLCSVEPLVPITANEQLPDDETSFYLESLLQYMVTQTTKPMWPAESAKHNQEHGFSFIFNMFKRIYLPHLYPNFTLPLELTTGPYYLNHSIDQYVDADSSYSDLHNRRSQVSSPTTLSPSKRDPLQTINLRQPNLVVQQQNSLSITSLELERSIVLSGYQAIIIKWLTRILRQDMIPGQDDLIKGGSAERVDRKLGGDATGSQVEHDTEYYYSAEGKSMTRFQGVEMSSRELDIARKCIGTWPENIAVVHELFRRSFLNYYQPASMKRVVNVYKEWICNGGPNQTNQGGRQTKLGYTSFSDLLQTFVNSSCNAFMTRVYNPSMLDEQVELCKRIMNIYRFMVMKIYMNTTTWEQLLNVMLSITARLFPAIPPEKKDCTIGGRIAPAFFQTFIVSWIRANLYVHISEQMWDEFHREMRNLVRWRELVEEWSTTMGSLTRVLVKHVYGLSLAELPLDKPQEGRRRRPKALKSLSTATETSPTKYPDQANSSSKRSTPFAKANTPVVTNPDNRLSTGDQSATAARRGSEKVNDGGLKDLSTRALVRCNSDGILYRSTKHCHSILREETSKASDCELRKIKSEYLLMDHGYYDTTDCRSGLTTHGDEVTVEGTSLRDSNMLFDNDSNIESSVRSNDTSNISSESNNKQPSSDKKNNAEKCVLLGGNARGWTNENSVVMWRRMLGLFGNINSIEDPDNHLIAVRCLASMLKDFLNTRENLGISMDNQSTPQQPDLIPPITYNIAWLLEATQRPRQYQGSRLEAYKLLCQMMIRRHDLELPQQYFTAFYEALLRGLMSPDPQVYGVIIGHTTQFLSLELPGCTFLSHVLYDKSREILLDSPKELSGESLPKVQAIQILNTILSLNKPIKKLKVLKPELNNPYDLVASGDIRAKIFDTFITYNNRPAVLENYFRSRSLCSLAIYLYHELCDRSSDSLEVEKLFDIIFTDLQHANDSNFFRINCDLLRLFSDHASWLASCRSVLVSSLIQIICQLIVRRSASPQDKEAIYCLLICLEDWCISVGKSYLVKPIDQLCPDESTDDTLTKGLSESLITIVLRSLESVINDEQFMDDSSNKGTKGSNLSTSKGSDTHSSGRQSQQSSNSNDRGQPWSKSMRQDNQRRFEMDPETKKNSESIKLACKVSHSRLITYLGHFPLRQVGASSMSCCVNEIDYLDIEQETLSMDLKNEPGIQILAVNDTTLVSFVGASSAGQLQDSGRPIHLIIRNLCGKYSWEISNQLSFETNAADASGSISSESDSIILDPDSFQEVSRFTLKCDSDFGEDSNSSGSMSSKSSANRDCICDLMNQLGYSIGSSSSASLINNDSGHQRRNSTHSGLASSRFRLVQAEETMIALLTNQQFQELNYCDRSDGHDRDVFHLNRGNGISCSRKPEDILSFTQRRGQLSFEHCRYLLQQLGYLSWEKRRKVESLTKSSRLLRELKNLDTQPCRETHKIAVIYVANGQEDKNSILMNSSGTRAFDMFVAGLGWEVNLASHLGFMGGLQSNKSTGETSTYYCNSTTEIMFHVSTRIPLNNQADDEALNKKLRHLGNDEIHIVWSEHSRDYRRGIIPTEFGDVIIAIYPMLTFSGYYRIHISSKQEVPMFGPLFDNCIVHQTSLAGLVRATAVNAGRAKRLRLPLYRSYFEERSRLIDTIVNNHREILSFEEFAIQMYGTSVRPGHLSQATAAASEATAATC